jgi:uncharacterized Tic20 family protein
MSTPSDDKIWNVLSHLSILLGVGILLPLIIYLCKKGDSPGVAAHAREALNFHLSLLIYSLLCLPLVFVCVGFPLLIVLSLGGLILGIIGGVKASEGSFYTYPLTLRLVR